MAIKNVRGFRVTVKKHMVFPDVKTQLPKRADAGSAGYDFYSKEDYLLAPGRTHIFWSDVKAYMNENEVLQLYIRSSLGIKHGLALSNSTGIIDSSYYGNESNNGNIGIAIVNNGNRPVKIKKGDRIAQGIFMNYLVADRDEVLKANRDGGMGSSNNGQ